LIVVAIQENCGRIWSLFFGKNFCQIWSTCYSARHSIVKIDVAVFAKKWSDRLFDPKQGDQIGGELF
jgi:hypothetical protein